MNLYRRFKAVRGFMDMLGRAGLIILFTLGLIAGLWGNADAYAPTLQESFVLAMMYEQRADTERDLVVKYERKRDYMISRAWEFNMQSGADFAEEISKYDFLIAEAEEAARRYESLAQQYLMQIRVAQAVQTSA